jgi:hypothetical protein
MVSEDSCAMGSGKAYVATRDRPGMSFPRIKGKY